MSQIVFDGMSLITPDTVAAELRTAASEHRIAADNARAQLALMLQLTELRFSTGVDLEQATMRINQDLHQIRSQVSPQVWESLVPVVQDHAVSAFMMQDPFTRWSFEKPRGYSGDAQLLDFIYRHPSAQDAITAASPVGQTLYQITSASQSSAAVRERRDLLTTYVDEVGETLGGGAEVLTIAAGHLREANSSAALRNGQLARWVALDQDPLSVGSMMRDFAGTAVEPMDGSVAGLLTDTYELGQFDFVYAAGLYDYLPRKVAIRLTKKCMQMLKPKGTFLFANFAAGIPDDGFMETFMNWSLLLRSEEEMWDIINASVDRNTVDAHVYHGDNRNIVYATIRKND
ncbi:class I SAM-dependent methyltransferase [Tianweitania sp. BSSL-BM11]|uniref:Class I SAM-dependent methyltransferase n=1 Tax=Tianweitania aestuarii TaxID=2814886 RepID=A0ABS5S0P4_9HYPH|nr:class I SAM-dependent methyltransferase [Tianweitania aestuarii]MBS9722039.1 class I SAM-dependent methyltransferase [Tianweitania aestuarii]